MSDTNASLPISKDDLIKSMGKTMAGLFRTAWEWRKRAELAERRLAEVEEFCKHGLTFYKERVNQRVRDDFERGLYAGKFHVYEKLSERIFTPAPTTDSTPAVSEEKA